MALAEVIKVTRLSLMSIKTLLVSPPFHEQHIQISGEEQIIIDFFTFVVG